MFSFSAIEHNAEIPDNFIDLRELIPGIMLDVRYYSTNNFTGERVPGYDAERAIGTLEMALQLKDVQRELEYANLQLKIFDAYRPQRAVDYFIRWAHDSADLRTKHLDFIHDAIHDGSELQAEDVRYSLLRLKEVSPNKADYADIRAA